jgi:hypothetical protein
MSAIIRHGRRIPFESENPARHKLATAARGAKRLEFWHDGGAVCLIAHDPGRGSHLARRFPSPVGTDVERYSGVIAQEGTQDRSGLAFEGRITSMSCGDQ